MGVLCFSTKHQDRDDIEVYRGTRLVKWWSKECGLCREGSLRLGPIRYFLLVGYLSY